MISIYIGYENTGYIREYGASINMKTHFHIITKCERKSLMTMTKKCIEDLKRYLFDKEQADEVGYEYGPNSYWPTIIPTDVNKIKNKSTKELEEMINLRNKIINFEELEQSNYYIEEKLLVGD